MRILAFALHQQDLSTLLSNSEESHKLHSYLAELPVVGCDLWFSCTGGVEQWVQGVASGEAALHS